MVMRFSVKWRLLALLGVILYALTVAGLLYLALHNILFLLLLVVTSAVFLYAAWLVFTGEKRRYRVGQLLIGLCAIALVIEVLLLAKESRHPATLIAVIIFGAAYGYLFRTLRRQYWAEKRQLSSAGVRAQFKKPFLIINPKSGGGRATKAHLEEHALRRGIKVVVMRKGQDMEALARNAIARGADVIGVSGGDGSIGAVAKVVLEYDVPLVVLPGGTRCHFARDIGLAPERIIDALSAFEGVERRVDVGNINGRIFLNNASLGLYAEIVDNPDYRDNKLAVTRKALRNIASGATPLYDLQFTGNGKRFLRSVRIEALPNNERYEGFSQWETIKFKVASKQRTIVVGVDGEREAYKSPVTVTCMAGALRLFVPAEGIRSRPYNLFSLAMLKELFRAARGNA
jgi:diacylglycerol kinase family enzyme